MLVLTGLVMLVLNRGPAFAAKKPNILVIWGDDVGVHNISVYNFMPFFQGKVKKSPREQIFYFGQGGELNVVRWNDWKVHFAIFEGNIATGIRDVTNWPTIIDLRADPYEEIMPQVVDTIHSHTPLTAA